MTKKRRSKTTRLLDRIRREAGPLRRETPLAWAERERRLTQGVSAIEGPFRALPYQRFLLEAVASRRYSEHCWMIAAQTIKTESINCVIGYFMDREPCGILLVYPTLDRGKDFSKKKLARMISSTPPLRRKVQSSRTRDSGNTVLSKEFPGGDIIISGSNSPASLRSSSRRVVIQDEIDSYEASAGSEGDPCVLADTRAENFPNAVRIKASTPTIKGSSRIEQKFDDSTRHRYHVPCHACGHKQWLKWGQVKWEKRPIEETRYVCEKCGSEWTDGDRIRAIHAGEWIAEDPTHHRLGAQMSALYRLVGLKTEVYRSYLHEFAATFLDRKKAGRMAICAWQNTFLAETYEEEVETIKPSDLQARAEEYSPDALPEECLVLVAAGDVQKDRIECAVTAVGRDDETWGVWKKIFDGDPEGDEVWNKLDEFLLYDFARIDGVPLTVERCFIDMKHKNRRVLQFCKPRLGRGVFACQGVNRVGIVVPPLLPPHPSRNNRALIPHWNVGVTVAKATLFDRLGLPLNEGDATPRGMHFPKGFGYDADHFKQLTSEKRKTRYSYGKAYSIFEKDNATVRNEALDIAVYTLAAIESLGPINWGKLAENRIAQRPKVEEPAPLTAEQLEAGVAPALTTKPVLPFRPPRRNFATSW